MLTPFRLLVLGTFALPLDRDTNIYHIF